MSGGGRPAQRNFGRTSAYPYRGESRFSQHDNRHGRDNESGEYHNNNRNFHGGAYRPRGGGRARYRGGYSARRGSRGGRRPSSGRSYSSRGGRGGGRSLRSDYVDDDGDVEMEPKARPGPYDRPQRRPQHQNDKYDRQKPQGPRWNLLTVINGASLDRDWLMTAIQKEAMVQFVPVQYHWDGENASFCIEDDRIAQTIKDCDKKISSPDGARLMILKMYCPPPITDAQLVFVEKALSDRYKTETLHLDASEMFHDTLLKENSINIRVKTARDLTILINVISEHIAGLTSLDLSSNRIFSLINLKNLVHRTPRLKCLNLSKNYLKNIKELDYIKEWDLTELSLDGNPVCGHYKVQSEYISAARDRFPNLLVLDGTKLPPPVKFDIEKATKLVPPLPNHIPDNVTQIIKEFVKQYFSIYDKNRDDLMQAYHINCMFSLCIPSSSRGPPLSAYFQHSRNLKKRGPSQKIALLKTSQAAVCALLKELPKTEHDLNGFCVDVPLVSPTLLKFIIRGIFREKISAKSRDIYRTFTRAFLCLTDGARLSIVNEELFVKNATSAEVQSAFAKPPITPSPSPVPEAICSPATSSAVPPNAIACPSKMDMIAAFAKDSGMNASFSEQCLNENNWDYAKAGQTFLTLKEQGKIPPQAFTP